MSEIRDCPKCGIINPPDTDQCECGYRFAQPQRRGQIYDDEKKRIKATEPWYRRNRSMLIVGVALAVLLPIGGRFTFHAYRMHLLRDTIADAIGKDLVLTEALLKSEISASNAGMLELSAKS